jgi:hypothetical protein
MTASLNKTLLCLSRFSPFVLRPYVSYAYVNVCNVVALNGLFFMTFFFRHLRKKSHEKRLLTLLMSVRPSLCLSVSVLFNSALTRRIFLKFVLRIVYETQQFLGDTNNIGHIWATSFGRD